MVQRAIRAALGEHPEVRRVSLVGSRARGTAHALSDWDFAVDVGDHDAVAADLPHLLARLQPLAQQWDRLSRHRCFMLMLPGPTKVDLIFDKQHTPEPPWRPGAANLAGIDRHFWDWAWWLHGKQRAGRADLVTAELVTMWHHLLGLLGVDDPPASLAAAVAAYRHARDAAEARFGVTIDRRLDAAVTAGGLASSHQRRRQP